MTDPGPDHDPYTIRPDRPDAAPTEAPRPEDSGSAHEPPSQRADPSSGSSSRNSDSGSGNGERPKIDKEAVSRVRRLILISALASITAIFLPPVGLALGVATAILTWRWWSALKTPGLTRMTTGVVVFGASFAIVIGSVGTVLAAMFATEISDYANCQTGANTHIAQDKCWTELTDAISDRLPGLTG